MNIETLKTIPKVELHCHLDGSLSKEYMENYLGRPLTEDMIQVSNDCESLAQYLEKFDLPISCIQTKEGLHGAGYDFIKHLHEENVVYVETRFAPLCSVNDSLDVKQVLQSVISGLEQGKQEFGIEYNVIVCCMRHHSEEENIKMLEAAREFLGKGVCAADLAGGEASFPMDQFMHLFQKAKEMGFPYTLHAGECGNAQNIVDSIAAGATRIGHGIAMGGKDEVKKLCKDNHIYIEMCPISNMQTKAIDRLEDYPINEFLKEGLLVTINTDNRTVSNTSLTKEYAFIQSAYGVRDENLLQMIRNGIEGAFATEDTKAKIRAILL